MCTSPVLFPGEAEQLLKFNFLNLFIKDVKIRQFIDFFLAVLYNRADGQMENCAHKKEAV